MRCGCGCVVLRCVACHPLLLRIEEACCGPKLLCPERHERSAPRRHRLRAFLDPHPRIGFLPRVTSRFVFRLPPRPACPVGAPCALRCVRCCTALCFAAAAMTIGASSTTASQPAVLPNSLHYHCRCHHRRGQRGTHSSSPGCQLPSSCPPQSATVGAKPRLPRPPRPCIACTARSIGCQSHSTYPRPLCLANAMHLYTSLARDAPLAECPTASKLRAHWPRASPHPPLPRLAGWLAEGHDVPV